MSREGGDGGERGRGGAGKGSPWAGARAGAGGPRREGGPAGRRSSDSPPRPARGAGSSPERDSGRDAPRGPWSRAEGGAKRSSPEQAPRGSRPPRPAEPDSRRHAHTDPRGSRGARFETAAERAAPARVQREPEQKICGLNAARAAFAARPEALRKVYLSESRIGALRELLAFCVAKRLGYRVVEDEELERITGSSHHEGVCLLMQPRSEFDLEGLLATLPRSGPVRLLWLDGVGNPHNLGAVLRSAAHFGVQAVLLPPQSTLSLSAAAARVAEGGAEHVPLVRLPGHGINDEIAALEQLAEAGFVSVATLPAGAPDLYAQPLPQRAVLVLGAEGEGMQKRLIEHCARAVSIPGSGRVESLNIANAVAVLLAEHWRQHPPRGERA
jgi:TrmH RNA methyltransferase